MRAVLQRVRKASVTVNEEVVGQIERGYTLLLGVAADDSTEQVAWLVNKVVGLRLFANERDKLDLDIRQIGGSILVVPQFTLLADTQRGRRPSFGAAAEPSHAESIYTAVAAAFAEFIPVQTGRFGADMQVHLVNDGPFTLVLEREPYQNS